MLGGKLKPQVKVTQVADSTFVVFFGFAAAKWEEGKLPPRNHCAFFVFIFPISGRRYGNVGWFFVKPCVSVCLSV